MTQIRAFCAVLFLQLFCFTTGFSITPYATPETFTIQGKNWRIFQAENMSLKQVNQKTVFQQNEYNESGSSSIDLFLDFENKIESVPNYKVFYSNFERNRFQSANGGNSGKFYFSENYISLLPNPSSLFAPGTTPGSFTIEFWLYPYKNYDNQYVIKYIGNNLSDEQDKNTYGYFIAVKNNRLVYQFENFFWSAKDSTKSLDSIEVSEEEALKLYRWEHHAITFDILRGQLTTYRNGVEQEIKWITANGKPNAPIYQPRIEDELSTPLLIGKNALFSLDNLKISKTALHHFYLKRFVNTNSFIITDVYKISENRITLKKINVSFNRPEYSYIKIGYRISDHYFTPDNDELKWVYVQNNLDSFPADYDKGKYIQYKILAYPYEDMNQDITIQSIQLEYNRDTVPYIPFITRLVPQDGMAQVNWVPTPEDDIAGYEIYYGNRSEDYVSSDAEEGKSPIYIPVSDTGRLTPMSFTLHGLVNEKPYFVAVRAVDKNGQKSPYSKEMYVRPSTVYNDKRYSIDR